MPFPVEFVPNVLAGGGAAAALCRDQAAFAWAKGHLTVKERRLPNKLPCACS